MGIIIENGMEIIREIIRKMTIIMIMGIVRVMIMMSTTEGVRSIIRRSIRGVVSVPE